MFAFSRTNILPPQKNCPLICQYLENKSINSCGVGRLESEQTLHISCKVWLERKPCSHLLKHIASLQNISWLDYLNNEYLTLWILKNIDPPQKR